MTFAPICVSCRREMRCRKNDYLFSDYDAAAVWAGDMFECESCKTQIVVGVAREPTMTAGEPEFAGGDFAWSNFQLCRGDAL